MSLRNRLFLTDAERGQARDIATDAIKVYGMGAESRLDRDIDAEPDRRRRRILKRARTDVYVHFSNYFIENPNLGEMPAA